MRDMMNGLRWVPLDEWFGLRVSLLLLEDVSQLALHQQPVCICQPTAGTRRCFTLCKEK